MMQDHRSIPLEVLREFVLAQSEVTSMRAVAAAIGIGRTTLRSFLNQNTTPHPRIRRLIALWYIAEHDKAPDMDLVRPYRSAMSILVSGLPPNEQDAAQNEAAAALYAVYVARHVPVPRWLELLLKA